MPNPKTPQIILIDKVEVTADGRGSFLKVTDLAGNTHRIAEKRHTLWPIYQNAHRGEPVLTIYETYNHIDYIADAKPITDELLKRAVVSLGEKVVDKQNDERNRSTSLSYSKDMVVANKIDQGALYEWAEKNYRFIKGEGVKEE